MSTTTSSEIITQSGRTLILSEEDRACLDEFEAMLDLIRDRTRSVADRYQAGAYLVGRPGSSKTFTVHETLERLDTPWTYRNSRMSPMGLYCLLEEHPEHVVVLDDIHTLFGQDAALQILMAALGGRPGQGRTVTYTTRDERKSFEFSGGVIAISNLPLGRDPLADAVASRVARLEHEPSDEMIAAFMRSQALKGFEDVSPGECLEVAEFVIAETRACDHRLDLRAMNKAWQDYRLDLHGKANRTWQDLVRSSLKRLVGEDRPRHEGRAARLARERKVAQELFERFPDDKAQRDAEWNRLVGSSPDSLYRRKRDLDRSGG
ncbi:hypothetical protein [Tautonia plasticadhaerens]|uniref:ATPase family associated with various cellular activities (AAA) n=1 Tax=Tautonia plasticadhaerens TaxID=2527974 RepID=A0A518H801_9BACT|nr:hypothetical protein [Tautonia plasticadhaerens]QDV36980.1 hypothetical protein ElP_49110 [Tautonia plasticadhaerens]